MKKSRVILITFLIILFSLILATFYKASLNHTNHLKEVAEKKLIEAAENCVWDDVCLDSKITLKYLIEKKYLKAEVNPITKKYYSEESYIEKEGNTYTFHEV